MADEPIGAASTEVPAAAAGSEPATTPASEPAATTPAPDGSTERPADTFVDEKFDLKTLSAEGLKAYKKLQGDWTRARQAEKAKYQVLEERLNSIQPLMDDPDVRAKAYYRQYGKYPDGYQPTYLPPQQPKEAQINPDDITDPVTRQIYLKQLEQDKANEAAAKEKHETMVKDTFASVKTFVDKLSPAHRQLWNENIKEINESATLYASKGMPVDKALTKAFNAACADKLVELGKLEAINAMKVKAQAPKPETTVNVGAGIVAGDYNTPEEAAAAAINEINNR